MSCLKEVSMFKIKWIILLSLYNCMRHLFEQQLQISEFIKDPASLKLLILAGTSIRPAEIVTVNKCISLIKLDLSSNQLTQVPLKFTNFPHMKILYLHDNQISSVSISKTNLQYMSLFDNQVKQYRASIIDANEKLVALDYHVITKAERIHHTSPHALSLLKWPIVEISQSLQHEEDYLNLLKAELFVINQVYKRANYTDTINKFFLTIRDVASFQRLRHSVTNEAFFQREIVRQSAEHWRQYSSKKAKLRRLFEGTPAQQLLYNRLQRIKKNRGIGVSDILNKFIKSIRERMHARRVLQRSLHAYKIYIPVYHLLELEIIKRPLKIYFKDSQYYYLQKIFLYVKKQFFTKKAFDILDNFDNLVIKSKKSFYIYRSKQRESQTVLLDMIRNSKGLVIGDKGVDKRSLIYNRQGHKKIQIKRVKKRQQGYDNSKYLATTAKLQKLYSRYDTLVQYQVKDRLVYSHILRIIKYFNSGNSDKILQNQAAYFQTQVVFEDKDAKPPKDKIFFTTYFYFQRVHAANVIQKWWRKNRAVKYSQRSIFSQIRTKRAHQLIGKWLRDLTFRHRLQISKYHSFLRASFKQVELLIQIDIYMNLPIPKDILRVTKQGFTQQAQLLYQTLHRNTEVQIVEMSGRSWAKFRFLGYQDAYQAIRLLSILTYRYYFNGTFLKLFTFSELHQKKDLQVYQHHIQKLFNIKINCIDHAQSKIVKKIDIDNVQSYFIWPYLEEGFANMFKPQEVQSLPISVFIYNKNRRPLKVNCDLMWICPSTIYHYRKRVKAIMRVRTPKKQMPTMDPSLLQHYLPHIRHKLKRERQFSMKQHKSLLQANRQRGNSQHTQLSLLSETLNIKRQ